MKDRKTQFESLADLIRSRSLQHSLDWNPSNYANSYQTALGNGEIVISYNEDGEVDFNGNQLPEFSLAFVNERGQTVHTIEAYTAADSVYGMLKEIYESAYDSYMMTDETYRSMMDDILKK